MAKCPSGYMTTKDAAGKWGVSVDDVREYCRSFGDEIRAYKGQEFPKSWFIPSDAQRPLFLGDLVSFSRDLLKQKDNPSETFAVADAQRKFSFLVKYGYLVKKNGCPQEEYQSYVFTPDGYDLAFEEDKQAKRLLSPSVVLLNVNFGLVNF